jgi:catechol 2,3-dioxygenase-like lactoylglutathione lyase family enzyme
VIGTLRNTVLDCPDPAALAAFYAELLGWSVAERDDDWWSIEPATGKPGIAFQLDPGHRAPTWPDPEWPQQLHLDIHIGDPASIGTAEATVLALGGRRLPSDTAETFRVYADPAGHPFCLVWA